jgi:probable rRNA maturation factor
MNLTLTNLHPSLRPPLKKWRKRILSILRLIRNDKKRYKGFSIREIHIALLNDSRIAESNWRFLKHKGPTDIITFDYQNGSAELLISLDTARKSAAEYAKTLDEELTLYIVHGILHLAGFDDKTPRKRVQMRKEEEFVLNRLDRKK